MSSSNINNNNSPKQFDLPQERIEEICEINRKLGLYINTIADFSEWVSANLSTLDIETWYSIYEEFVQNNQDLIEKINKIRSNPNHNFHPPCLSSSFYNNNID